MKFHSTQTVNSSRRRFRSGLKLIFAAAIVWTFSNATAADVYVAFEGEKTTWHEGFDRYDFMMDDATGAIRPMTAPASEVTSFGIDVNEALVRRVKMDMLKQAARIERQQVRTPQVERSQVRRPPKVPPRRSHRS